jgi:2,4-dienoyl-CoA reductase-like NADH-dependent reductase (Old Yellow Enzyme family)/thioredoxin reductase
MNMDFRLGGRMKSSRCRKNEEALMNYPHLFQPFQIGSIPLKNRLVMSQMTMNYATKEGLATEKVIRHYVERAKGGVGLIFVEGTFFTPEGRGYVQQLGLSSSEHVERLKELTGAVHGLNKDVKIFIQIQHAGGRAYQKVTGLQPVAPSGFPLYPGADTPRPLTRDEIRRLVEAHIEAAARAKEAGFDGVDIHCAHGYLVPEFFSPLFNRREDEYGGDLTGRTRFLTEIVKGIKGRMGRDFPLTIKISGDEYAEGGLGLEEMKEIALVAQEAGVDGMMVSAGTPGGKKIEDLSQAHKVLRTMPMMTGPGCLVSLAMGIKKVLKIPVIAVGRIHRPVLAEEIISQGKADLVAMGRALLADPYLPQKAFEGRENEIRPCIGCNEGCYKRIFQQLDIQCSVNPTLGREREILSGQALKPKKVFIVGSGPAGLEAAYAAWEKGHHVSLIEKERKLGGQLNLAPLPPGRKEIERFREFLVKRLKRAEVRVIKGRRAVMPLIKKERPDVVILASGASPRCVEIPGLRKDRVLTAWEVLSGKKVPKGDCLVLGAGLVGCETADFLSEKGVKVVVVEILPDIATGSDADTKTYFELRFQKNGVRVYTRTEVQRMEGKIAILKRDNEEIRLETGTVIFAVGADANDELHDELRAAGIFVVKAGDCMKPRRILEAVKEGFEAGRAV